MLFKTHKDIQIDYKKHLRITIKLNRGLVLLYVQIKDTKNNRIKGKHHNKIPLKKNKENTRRKENKL
jgi:hypothetical protein